MSEENQQHSDEKQAQIKPEKDPGMKWVIFADILGAVIIALLVWAAMIKKTADEYETAEAAAPAYSYSSLSNDVTLSAVESTNYDFDLPLQPQECNNISGTVDMVLITDANYMDFTRVAINSAKQNKCPQSVYHIYVMTVDISDSDVEALKALAAADVSITILPQRETDLFYIRDTHVSKASLLKYYIAEALPNLEKVLYLDSDILVLRDLNALYQTDVQNVYLAAVKDPSWFFENTHVLELNLEERGFYFNSGVMLMNLAKFRADGLLQKLEDFTNNNFRTYMDQDALNVVVEKDVLELPFEANAMNFFFEHVDLPTLGHFYGREWKNYVDVFAPVTVLHFASSKKPLGAEASHDQFFRMLQRLWYKYYTPLPPLD